MGRCVCGGGGVRVGGAAVAGLVPGQALVVWVNKKNTKTLKH